MTPRAAIARLLLEAARSLAAIESDAPRAEAEHLLAFATGVTRARLALLDDAALTHAARERFAGLLGRRLSREPLQYILGDVPFAGLDLAVGPGVLIPRPETEALVLEITRELEALESEPSFLASPSPRWMIDAGTGSGAILYALLARAPGWRGVGVDISAEALRYAAKNRPQEQRERAFLLRGDLLQALSPHGRGSVWIVTANLPYIPRGELEALAPEVREHEPPLALDGGEDGLDLVRRLWPEAARILRPHGVLALELAIDQPERVANELAASGAFSLARTIHDWSGRPRGVIARRAA